MSLHDPSPATPDRVADWVLKVEAGLTWVMVGSSSEDIRREGSFEIVGEVRSLFTNRVFSCPAGLKQE